MIGVLTAVVYAGEEDILDEDDTRLIQGKGPQLLLDPAERVQAIDRHERASKLIVRCIEGYGQTQFSEVQCSEFPDAVGMPRG